MANGDAAAAAGYDTVPGTADRRLGYDEINKTRDYVANLKTGLAIPAERVSSGVLDPARIPNLDGSKITAGQVPNAGQAVKLQSGAASVVWDSAAWILSGIVFATGDCRAGANVSAAADVVAAGNVWGGATYNNILGGSYRAMYVRSDGVFGHVPSARRFKKNIRPANIDTAAVLSLEPKHFEYRAALGGGSDVGVIAEEVADAGLDWLVSRDDDGQVAAFAYERLAVALLAVAREQAEQIATLTTRIENLEAR